MLRLEERHIFRTETPTNLKLSTQMENEDPYHRKAPWPPMFMVKVARSHDPSDRFWPMSEEQKVPEISKLVGRLPNRRVIMRTWFVGKRSRSPGRLMLELKVCRIMNFKLRRRLEHTLSTAMASYKGLWSWYLKRIVKNLSLWYLTQTWLNLLIQ